MTTEYEQPIIDFPTSYGQGFVEIRNVGDTYPNPGPFPYTANTINVNRTVAGGDIVLIMPDQRTLPNKRTFHFLRDLGLVKLTFRPQPGEPLALINGINGDLVFPTSVSSRFLCIFNTGIQWTVISFMIQASSHHPNITFSGAVAIIGSDATPNTGTIFSLTIPGGFIQDNDTDQLVAEIGFVRDGGDDTFVGFRQTGSVSFITGFQGDCTLPADSRQVVKLYKQSSLGGQSTVIEVQDTCGIGGAGQVSAVQITNFPTASLNLSLPIDLILWTENNSTNSTIRSVVIHKWP